VVGEEAQNGAGIVHCFAVREFFQRRQRLCARDRVEPIQRDRPSTLIADFAHDHGLPVVEVGHHAAIAHGRDPARDVVKLLAYAPDVHIEDHGGIRAVLFRMDNKCPH
jgi:hypothetical protein